MQQQKQWLEKAAKSATWPPQAAVVFAEQLHTDAHVVTSVTHEAIKVSANIASWQRSDNATLATKLEHHLIVGFTPLPQPTQDR